MFRPSLPGVTPKGTTATRPVTPKGLDELTTNLSFIQEHYHVTLVFSCRGPDRLRVAFWL